jgi:hypothetical protein
MWTRTTAIIVGSLVLGTTSAVALNLHLVQRQLDERNDESRIGFVAPPAPTVTHSTAPEILPSSTPIDEDELQRTAAPSPRTKSPQPVPSASETEDSDPKTRDDIDDETTRDDIDEEGVMDDPSAVGDN